MRRFIFALIVIIGAFFLVGCGASGEDDFEDVHTEPIATEPAAEVEPITSEPEDAEAVLTIRAIPPERAHEMEDFGMVYPDWVSPEHDLIVLSSNVPIRDLAISAVNFHYSASFDGSWDLQRHYGITWERFVVDLTPERPIVTAFWPSGESGEYGISFNGQDFLLRQDENAQFYLEEFGNIPNIWEREQITIVSIEPGIQLVAAWLPTPESHGFLEGFETLARFDEPETASLVLFGVNVPLNDFRYARIGHNDHPQVGDNLYFFYVGETINYIGILEPRTPAVISWSAGGTWPTATFTFVDENGVRRSFWMHSNNASGGFPMSIHEFVDMPLN
ncbi:MAG: hypothetical protein FWB74_05495 [Defluviitaleaceae bacterium]|nr:hypothetical protein [Defluviitaleaceae bacterium]